MESTELKTLEEKTRNIVETLGILEKETKDYQTKNFDIVSAINNLASISEQIADASKELSNSAKLFGKSDFSNAMKELDKRIDKINEAEIEFIDQSNKLNIIVENVLSEYNKLRNEIKSVNDNINKFLVIKDTIHETKQLLELVSAKIDRVDRNTQKGFGKEKG